MRKIKKRCCSFILGVAIATSMFQGTVYAAKDSSSGTTPSNIPINEVQGKVDSYMESYIGDSVSGAIVVAVKDNKVVLEKAYGDSNLENETPISLTDTTFELGSLTKMYTYTAVMQQVEAGTIDLQADIFTYLPEDFISKLKEKLISDKPITVMELINNTAGFEETGFDIAVSDTKSLDLTLKDALLTTMPAQIYDPGEVMTGSSYCSALAGYIIECVTGMEFSTYVQNNVFEKAGMTSTTMLANTKNVPAIDGKKAVPYGLGDGGEFRQVDYMYSNLYPSGAGVTNGDDFAKFLQSYVSTKEEKNALLKQDTIKKMFEKTYSINENARGQGIGFYEYPSDQITAYYHEGTSNGYSSMMTIMPEEEFGVGVLCNSSVSTEFMYGLMNLLLVNPEEKQTSGQQESLTTPSLDDFTNLSFTGSKRAYNNVLQFVGYFGNCSSFTKGDDNTIVLDNNKYKQVKPYVFEYAGTTNAETSNILTDTVAKNIYFGHNEKGEVTKWSYGCTGAGEFVADSSTSAQSNLTLSILVIMLAGLLCAIMFSTNLVITAIDLIHKKPILNTPRGAFRISTFLFVGLVLNSVTQITELLETTLLSSKDFYWNTMGNYGLSIAIILSLGYFMYCYAKEKPKAIKLVLYGMVYAFMSLYIYLLFIWKFFSFA
ncbi:MAG: serine hydrolase domain-containing protein [bacterium]|nr:serine hydrolase domain-containing protein [bacterium]